ERRIQNIGTVSSRDQDHAFVRLEAVHLDEQLVERLLALVVSTAESRATVPADRIDLVDEDDAGGVLFPLLEEIADARGTDADEHFDEIGTADREERNVGFTGDRTSQQRLAGSRRAHQQHALRDSSTELLKLLGLFEELDDFL